MSNGKKAIVIGSGVAGLAASVRLARAGYETHVYESNSFPGGKINTIDLNGYRFDRGPSIFTAPEYLEDLYKLCGKDFSSFETIKMGHSFNYFFNDETRLQFTGDNEQLIAELASKLNEDENQLRKYLKKSAKNYKTIAPLFIEKSLHRTKKLFGKDLFRALARLPKYKLYSTMHEENKSFFKNSKTVQVFDRFATYNGSSPYKAPAMLNMIPHLEMNVPPVLPKNGMIQITDSLVDLAKSQGVQFHFNSTVDEIKVENGRVNAIQSKGEWIAADVVFSNMDVALTYEKLLPNAKAPTKILNQERSSSAIVFYWGIKKEFPELSLHNVFFSDDYEAEFKGLFEKDDVIDDPTIYINITSKFVKQDAPEEGENWFVMINAPKNSGQDWEEIVQRTRRNTIDKINRSLNIDLESLIEVEDILDPTIIESRYSGKMGSIYGNASNNRYAAFYRHANFSKELKGLYFVGVSVHPGGGIPLAINSAKIAMEHLQDHPLD